MFEATIYPYLEIDVADLLSAQTVYERELDSTRAYQQIRKSIQAAEALKLLGLNVAEVKQKAEWVILIGNRCIGENTQAGSAMNSDQMCSPRKWRRRRCLTLLARVLDEQDRPQLTAIHPVDDMRDWQQPQSPAPMRPSQEAAGKPIGALNWSRAWGEKLEAQEPHPAPLAGCIDGTVG